MSFTSIPFKIEGMHGGFSQVDGIGKFSSVGIVLEFEAKIFGIMKTGVQEVRLPLAEILDIKFKKGFFKYGAKIEIRLKSFAKLSELPNKDGKIQLKIPRDDHAKANETVQEMQKNLNEYMQSLPPNQVSVKELFDGETKELN
ncbi:MAG: hypothetical protein MUC29_01365 [Pyrinomonadaceae bacterium]|jgi:hypothetical protein|nr:hypothetical protein [Pyrinomonadaceae bacterium]